MQAFITLGRTDKNQLIDDVGKNVDGSQGYGTNPRGRYPLHFHRTGVDDSSREWRRGTPL